MSVKTWPLLLVVWNLNPCWAGDQVQNIRNNINVNGNHNVINNQVIIESSDGSEKPTRKRHESNPKAEVKETEHVVLYCRSAKVRIERNWQSGRPNDRSVSEYFFCGLGSTKEAAVAMGRRLCFEKHIGHRDGYGPGYHTKEEHSCTEIPENEQRCFAIPRLPPGASKRAEENNVSRVSDTCRNLRDVVPRP